MFGHNAVRSINVTVFIDPTTDKNKMRSFGWNCLSSRCLSISKILPRCCSLFLSVLVTVLVNVSRAWQYSVRLTWKVKSCWWCESCLQKKRVVENVAKSCDLWQLYGSTKSLEVFFFFLNFLEDISPFRGATDTLVLDFWWRLLWVSKPGWIPFACFLACIILRFTSGATPADCIEVSMAAESWSTYLETCSL